MKNNKNFIKVSMLILLETIILMALFSFIPQDVLAGIGSPSITTITEFEVENSFPEIQNITINGGTAITLIPNSTKTVECIGIIIDYNGDTDIKTANATFFDSSISQTDPDDNNDHYTNPSCEINRTFGSYAGINDDAYKALASCTFEIEYYANPGLWNCSMQVNDSVNNKGTGAEEEVISELLALGLPATINYGTVNATYVSDENITNITNYGNVEINLSLEGYGASQGDGSAMNCTFGSVGNISIEYEKYNLTASTPGVLSLSETEATHTNLTTTPEIKQFNLGPRMDDTTNDAIKESYWRIYVPKGVAGTCTGNIIFGATTAAGS